MYYLFKSDQTLTKSATRSNLIVAIEQLSILTEKFFAQSLKDYILSQKLSFILNIFLFFFFGLLLHLYFSKHLN